MKSQRQQAMSLILYLVLCEGIDMFYFMIQYNFIQAVNEKYKKQTFLIF
jgi:hypothetical protein